jgi:hypothetical protein
MSREEKYEKGGREKTRKMFMEMEKGKVKRKF